MMALRQQEGWVQTSSMGRCKAPPLYVPASVLSVRTKDPVPDLSKGKGRALEDAEADCDPDVYSMKSVSSVILSFNSSSPSYSREGTAARVRTALSALGVAGSANTLTLSQAILNALVRIIMQSTLNNSAIRRKVHILDINNFCSQRKKFGGIP